MQRRNAIKMLTGIFGAAVALPSWAESWDSVKLKDPSLLNQVQKKTLSSLVDTILPATDKPGALELGVDRFVEVMVQDCFDENVQQQLKSGLNKLEEAARKQSATGFAGLDKPSRLELVKSFSKTRQGEPEAFVNSVKNLTVQGYTNSEYYMTEVSKYELVPARYHGCVEATV